MDEDDQLVEETPGAPGDEWEAIDVADDEADRLARSQDRGLEEFRRQLKDAEHFKVEDSVFDDATLAAIYKLVQDGYITAFGGPVSTGKEANVYEAHGAEGKGHDVAVKVYRISASDFQRMEEYLAGDPRFEGLGSDKRKIVQAWVRKEYANLERAQAAGVRVPDPIAVQRNVLVMEYLGVEGDPAPRLENVDVENPETAFEVIREYMRRLYAAGLVHGDLSEYNVVIWNGELCIIDVGQAVTIHHPNSEEFLRRDCENVATFFGRYGLEIDATELFDSVTDVDPAP